MERNNCIYLQNFDNVAEHKSPIEWRWAAVGDAYGDYRIKAIYTVFETSRSKVIKREEEIEFQFDEEELELANRKEAGDSISYGRFGLVLDCAFFENASIRKGLEFKKELRRKEVELRSSELVEDYFRKSPKLKEAAKMEVLAKRMRDETGGFEIIRRGEEIIESYVNCI